MVARCVGANQVRVIRLTVAKTADCPSPKMDRAHQRTEVEPAMACSAKPNDQIRIIPVKTRCTPTMSLRAPSGTWQNV